jgi:hypothetical protein
MVSFRINPGIVVFDDVCGFGTQDYEVDGAVGDGQDTGLVGEEVEGRALRLVPYFPICRQVVSDCRMFVSGTKVYVGNLSWDASWQDLKDFMRGPSQDLSVAHVDVMTESSGRSKGCAIVEYSTVEVISSFVFMNLNCPLPHSKCFHAHL